MGQDVTSESSTHWWLKITQSALHALAGVKRVDDALPHLLQVLGEQLHWQAGEFWLVDEGGEALHRAGIWIAPSMDESLAQRAQPLRRFDHGEGLPGRVWQHGRPLWVRDVREDPQTVRTELARDFGFVSALAIPVRSEQAVLGVMALYTTRVVEPDQPLLTLLDAIGEQFGAFIERTRAYEALAERETQLRYRTVLLEAQSEASVEGILVSCGDTEQHLLNWNRQFQQMWGFTAQQMRSLTDVELLYEASQQTAHPELFVQSIRHYCDNPDATGRNEVRMADGRVLEFYSAPVADENGQILGRGWYFRDITDHKQTEHQLEERERRFRTLVSNIPGVVYRCALDEHWTMHYLSEAIEQLSGYPSSDLIENRARSYASLVHPDDQDRIQREVQAAVSAHRPFTLEYRICHRDGSIRWVYEQGRAVLDASGAPLWLDGVILDITSRKEAEAFADREYAEARRRAAQLQHLAAELTQTEQRERRRFARLLHDDLQQLLTAIKMRTSMLQQKAGDTEADPVLAEINELAEQSVNTTQSLTGQLSPPLLYEAGLVPAVEWLARWMQRNYALTVNVDADEHVRITDEPMRVLLFEGVRELLFNVVKHAGTDRADVTVALTDDRVRITVQDRGRGFDPDNQAAAQEDEFGLLSLRERLDWVGGAMQIHAEPGAGTRIVMEAPVHGREAGAATGEPAPAQAPEQSAPAAGAAEAAVLRIMLVDDHRVVRAGLAMMIGDTDGLEIVAEAASGTEAVELAREQSPDVIVMDVTLPGLSGVEATRQIKTILPHTRIIGLSVHPAEDMAEKMHAAGADAYLNKAGPAEELLAEIQRRQNGREREA